MYYIKIFSVYNCQRLVWVDISSSSLGFLGLHLCVLGGAFIVGLSYDVALVENFHLGSNQACTIEIQISNTITHS